MMTEKVENKQGFAARAKKYFSECKTELKKVTWPSKKQLINNSIIIIVFITGIHIKSLISTYLYFFKKI